MLGEGVLEVVAAAMASTRNFLSQKHTDEVAARRGSVHHETGQRGSWESWADGGRTGRVERAQAEAVKILREHHVPPLEPAQERELDALLFASSPTGCFAMKRLAGR